MTLLYHTFSMPKKKYVFDGNSNSILNVDEKDFNALKAIEDGELTEENNRVIRRFQAQGFCCDSTIQEIRHPDTDTLYVHLNRKLLQATLQVTQCCNLRCEYCAYSGQYKQRTHAPKRMDFDTAKRSIDFALERSIDTPLFYFGFYGGEPLLEFELITKCVAYIEEKTTDRNIRFTITTNGTLLTVEIYEYLVEHNFDIMISLDGPKEIHDQSRKFKDGTGSFDIIMKNIEAIREKYPKSIDRILFNAVLNPELDDSCVKLMFKADEIFPFYNVVSNIVTDLYKEKKVEYNETFLLLYEHERCKHLLGLLGKLDQKYISPILKKDDSTYDHEYRMLKRIPKIPEICHPSGPCITGAMRLFISVDGIFYPCERVSEASELMVIGDLDHGFDYERAKLLLNPGCITNRQCKKCWSILHCTLCSAFADDLKELSKQKRLSYCDTIHYQFENTLKTICFLKDAGYQFK